MQQTLGARSTRRDRFAPDLACRVAPRRPPNIAMPRGEQVAAWPDDRNILHRWRPTFWRPGWSEHTLARGGARSSARNRPGGRRLHARPRIAVGIESLGSSRSAGPSRKRAPRRQAEPLRPVSTASRATGWLTVSESAQRLSRSPSNVSWFIKKGRLPAMKDVNRRVWLRESDVDTHRSRRTCGSPTRRPPSSLGVSKAAVWPL